MLDRVTGDLGKIKTQVCGGFSPEEGMRLADVVGVSQQERKHFPYGLVAEYVWDWLERRHRLLELVDAFTFLQRDDLLLILRQGDFDRIVRENRSRPALSARADPAESFHLADTAFFDLSDIRYSFEEALSRGPGPVAFVLTYPEEVLVTNLCKWLEHWGFQRRQALSLRAFSGGVDKALQTLEKLRSVITTADVLLPIRVEADIEEAELSRFWTGVRQNFDGLDRRLILLVQLHTEDLSCGDMIHLPAPRFVRKDVSEWGRNLTVSIGWPLELVHPLSNAVFAYAETDGVLDIGDVYDALEGFVADLRKEQDCIRALLKEGKYCAHAA